jgi:hypothetical protein
MFSCCFDGQILTEGFSQTSPELAQIGPVGVEEIVDVAGASCPDGFLSNVAGARPDRSGGG